MIDLQYNFPLLPETPAQWSERLLAAVSEEAKQAFDGLRPSFRLDLQPVVRSAAGWLGMPEERLFLVEGMHHALLVALLASGMAAQGLALDCLAYSGALEQARLLSTRLWPCAVDREGMTPSALESACQQAQRQGAPIRGVYLTPTVHNPLGITASLQRRLELCEVARAFDLALFEDNAYGFLDPAAPASFAELAPERSFFLDGMSKCYAPAARLGFVLAPERWRERVPVAIKNSTSGVSVPHARAVAGLIDDGVLEQVVARKNQEGAWRNEQARRLLGEAVSPGVPNAWHLWVPLPERLSPQAFELHMAGKGVALSGGNWFAAAEAPNGVRLALGGEVERARLLEGVALVAEQLQRLTA
ncbi:MAG: PLP-dependent aminotransferase family protein [Acidobacteriaceae bacterium]|nr:PLP-dependent aminotransferase family protein [Acidobacteriaceae bacterium]